MNVHVSFFCLFLPCLVTSLILDGDTSTSTDQTLTINDLRVILKALKELEPQKVFAFGVQLGVPIRALKKHEVNHQSDVDRRLSEAIEHWLRNDQGCTWNRISEALCEVDEKNLGHKIRDEYVLEELDDPRVRIMVVIRFMTVIQCSYLCIHIISTSFILLHILLGYTT